MNYNNCLYQKLISNKLFDCFDKFQIDEFTVQLYERVKGFKLSGTREHDIIYRRNFLVITMLKNGYNLNQVGEVFEIDHATVLSLIKRTLILLEVDDSKIYRSKMSVLRFLDENGFYKEKFTRQHNCIGTLEMISCNLMEKNYNAIRQAI